MGPSRVAQRSAHRLFLPLGHSVTPASNAEHPPQRFIQFFADGRKFRAQPPVEVCPGPPISPLESRIVVAAWEELELPLTGTKTRDEITEG